jgi:hypothetical protein
VEERFTTNDFGVGRFFLRAKFGRDHHRATYKSAEEKFQVCNFILLIISILPYLIQTIFNAC